MSFTFVLLDDTTTALHFYKAHRDKTRFSQGDKAFVLLDGKQIVAALKLSRISEQSQNDALTPHCFFMRSVLVDPNYRRKGLALSLIKQTLQYVKRQNESARIICFPFYHLETLYECCGFQLMTEKDLPSGLQKNWQRYDTAIKADRMTSVIMMQWCC